MQKNKSSASQQDIPFYLCLLTLFFVLLEISFFIQCNKAYLSDFTFVSHQLNIPVRILPGILFFIGAQCLTHLAFCLLVWFSAVFNGYLFKLNSNQQFLFAIILWMVGMGAAFAANQFFYPYSKFAELSSIILFSPDLAKNTALFLGSSFTLTLAGAAAGLIVWIFKRSFSFKIILASLITATSWLMLPHTAIPLRHDLHEQPNIFIIGIDSLRPDFLGFFGSYYQTPFLDRMLNESTVFSEAVTPLARTFPSWMSILTGEHPRHSGIRSNLVNLEQVNLNKSIPAILKQYGYETIYATDETRFSNIDAHMGFDEVISPPIGLNDFLLGTFNDFPLSNLLVNTKVGRFLFPYSYANRPAFHTYNPGSFISLIRNSLEQPRNKPIMMAVHFCLPHSPYAFANTHPGSGEQTPATRYLESVMRVDAQLKSFFKLLNKSGLLDHAIVVLLSDHGEALEFPGDRITEQDLYLGKRSADGGLPNFYPPSLDDEAVNQSAGHGTDVLGLPQYHTLLAFKLYGMGKQRIGEVSGVVPLSDIKSTLLTLARIKQQQPSALAAIIRGQDIQVPLQHVFIESDFSPESIRTVYPETRQVMLDGVRLYEINPATTRLTIKPEMNDMILHSKQYADIYGDWMLAFYPQNNHYHMPILVNLQTGQWTNDLHSRFAQQSPANMMRQQLKHFYGSELNDVKS